MLPDVLTLGSLRDVLAHDVVVVIGEEALEGEVDVAAVAELPGTMPAEFRFPECFILSVGNIGRSVGLVDFTPEGVEP